MRYSTKLILLRIELDAMIMYTAYKIKNYSQSENNFSNLTKITMRKSTAKCELKKFSIILIQILILYLSLPNKRHYKTFLTIRDNDKIQYILS